MRTLFSPLLLVVALLLAGCDSAGLSDFDPGSDCRTDCGGDPGAGDPDAGDPGGDTGDTGDGDADTDGDAADAVVLTLDPTATYLRTEGSDALAAVAVPLGDLGVTAGQTACFLMKGDVDFGDGSTSASLGVPGVLAVFSRTSELLADAERERVVAALDAGDDVVSPGTNPSDLPTDVDQDFDATDACVVVPDAAEFVFFSAFDSYFLDNLPAGEYGVEVRRP